MRHRTALAVWVALITLVCIGAALRIYAFAGNPSLWLDEAAPVAAAEAEPEPEADRHQPG